MEAANIGRVRPTWRRGRSTGGRSPAGRPPTGSARLAAFAGTTFMLSMNNSGLVGHGGLVGGGLLPMIAGLALAYRGIAQLVAGSGRSGPGTRRGGRVLLLRRVLDLVLPDRPARRGRGARAKGRRLRRALAVPVHVDDLHRLHVRRVVAQSGAVALVFLLLTMTFLLLAIRNASLVGAPASPTTRSSSAAMSARNRDRRLVRLVRRGDQLDLRSGGRASRPAPAINGGKGPRRSCAGVELPARNRRKEESASGVPAATPALRVVHVDAGSRAARVAPRC